MSVTPPHVGATRKRLIAASCALLGATAARAQQPADTTGTPAGSSSATSPSRASPTPVENANISVDRPWVIDSAIAYYRENDGRLSSVEPVIGVRHDFGDERILGVSATFDVLSGGSPIGAAPSRQPQTFVTPSGIALKSPAGAPLTYTNTSGKQVAALYKFSPYTTAPGALPIDDSLHGHRIAFTGDWQAPLNEVSRYNYGGTLSDGSDLVQILANGTYAYDFNEKNTTLSFGANGELDSVKPLGGTPLAGSDYLLFQKLKSKSRHDFGALFGVHQVMTRRWWAELHVALDRELGYLNDPYQIISIVNSTGGVYDYVYESRPDTRTRRSVFLEDRYALDRGMVDLSLRHMTDSWGLRSDTAEVRFRYWNPQRDRYLEPLFRWYKQTAADFYTPFVTSITAPITGYASADQRLSAFHALTFGLKYGVKVDEEREFSVRLEEYRQTFDNKLNVPSGLQGLDFYPGVNAIFLQFGWRFAY
jgi:hypothetical protein